MIEINNDQPFTLYDAGWHCRRCNQFVPFERVYTLDGTWEVLRATDLVDNAAIVGQISNCRLIIIMVAAALVGALTVGTIDRTPLRLATPFDDVVIDIFRALCGVLLYGMGALILGMIIDKTLSSSILNRAAEKRRQEKLTTLKEKTG
jgi:hypothetical protein